MIFIREDVTIFRRHWHLRSALDLWEKRHTSYDPTIVLSLSCHHRCAHHSTILFRVPASHELSFREDSWEAKSKISILVTTELRIGAEAFVNVET